jgi:hypothetical protein
METRKRYVGMIAAALICLCATAADAAPIYGSFSLWVDALPVNGATGAYTVDANGDPTFAGATGLDFTNVDGSNSVGTGEFIVRNPKGDFLSNGLTQGTIGTIKDFTFAGTPSAAYPLPPLTGFEAVTVGDLTFDLETITVVTQNDTYLSLWGTGYFNWVNKGFDRTYGTFSLTGTEQGGSISFAAAEVAPEPGSLVLLGSGIVAGLSRLRRRQRA